MTDAPAPFREPVRTTLIRTGAIAVGIGVILAGASGRGVRALPVATLIALWPSLGGHFVELFFLNVLRPRLPGGRGVRVAARIAVWFVGGAVLMAAMAISARMIPGARPIRGPLWVGGVAFVGIELMAHLVMRARGVDSFYNGRG